MSVTSIHNDYSYVYTFVGLGLKNNGVTKTAEGGVGGSTEASELLRSVQLERESSAVDSELGSILTRSTKPTSARRY